MPGQIAFSPTNVTPPLLLAGLGNTFQLAGYAKQRLLNGYTNVFAYLGQYFDQACVIDTNGVVTTNHAGFLSPYGAFSPTLPGPAALVTMTNLGVNERGTAIVQVVSMAMDFNHDGSIDPAFGGPDSTSLNRPFVFWVNNDFDRLAKDNDDNVYYEDSVPPTGSPATPTKVTPDFNYMDSLGNRVIPTQRDLEDFARLWVCGITTNLSGSAPRHHLTLSWGDVGNPNPANPTIDCSRPLTRMVASAI